MWTCRILKNSWILSFLATAVLSNFGMSAIARAATGIITRNDCFDRYTPMDRYGSRGRGGEGPLGRLMGERNAKRLVGSIWSSLGGTCDQLDRLTQILGDTPLSRPYRGGTFAACFYMGYTDATWDEVDKIYDKCQRKCFSAGESIGEISAIGYCAASMAVGGLLDPGFIEQPPLPFCGQNLAIGCKTQYVRTATWEFPGCSYYTQNQFAETFDNNVRWDCFVPSDVPIRSGRELF